MKQKTFNEKDIQAKIEEIKQNKEDFIVQANKDFDRQLAAFDGAIMGLQALLEPEEKEENAEELKTQ